MTLDPQPHTPGEAAKLARARAQLEAIQAQLPPGASIELGFLDDQGVVDQIAANDAAVFVRASAFSYEQILGTTLPVLPCAEIDGLEWLRGAVMAGRVTCRYFGICSELERAPMPLSVMFRLVTMGQETPLYVDISAADEEWQEAAMDRLVVAWPPLPDGRRPYIATGPMRRFDKPTVVDPKIGRNDPCPCGSGVKFKRCHGG